MKTKTKRGRKEPSESRGSLLKFEPYWMATLEKAKGQKSYVKRAPIF